jgi:hypothetical protein
VAQVLMAARGMILGSAPPNGCLGSTNAAPPGVASRKLPDVTVVAAARGSLCAAAAPEARMLLRTLIVLLLAAPCALLQARELHRIPVGERVSIPAFTYAEGKAFTQEIHLRRVEVYAPDARILLPLADGRHRELPRSDRHYFVADRERTASRLYLSVSATGHDFEGALFDADGTYSFSGTIKNGRLQWTTGSKQSAAEAQDFRCGSDHEHAAAGGGGADLVLPELAPLAKGATHIAVIAVDTDNEMFTQKFTDNPAGLTAATNYLAALFTAMNVFYGPDLNVSLMQGTTFLRAPHASGADPYSQSSTSNQLDEVGALWRTTPALSAINRAFVMFLSGKSGSPNSASGIAWVLTSGNYCTAKGTLMGNGRTSGHFSVSQVFRFAAQTAANDVRLVGHELGHNFGAFHTHCSSATTGAGTVSTNTIDQCFTGESGCYSGPVSCPTDTSTPGRGSIMSYCNFGTQSGGANCGQVLGEFHPAQQLLLGARVATNIGNGCFTALTQNVGPTLSATSPASGSTTAMSGGAVGAVVTSNIGFMVSGGMGSGTTTLQCSVASGTVSIASGTPQNIAVGGAATPIVARFTLAAAAQSGSLSCSATPQGGSVSNFTYSFTAPAGAAVCEGSCVFRSSFETGGG